MGSISRTSLYSPPMRESNTALSIHHNVHTPGLKLACNWYAIGGDLFVDIECLDILWVWPCVHRHDILTILIQHSEDPDILVPVRKVHIKQNMVRKATCAHDRHSTCGCRTWPHEKMRGFTESGENELNRLRYRIWWEWRVVRLIDRFWFYILYLLAWNSRESNALPPRNKTSWAILVTYWGSCRLFGSLP